MKTCLLVSAAVLAITTPAFAQNADPSPTGDAAPAKRDVAEKEVFSTGVAKGRDRLDSATSTSALKGDDIQTLGARSLAEILRNIPGIRTESSTGEGNSNYTIRGLPLASGGSKYMQLEEDGLPVLEFGDIFNVASDIFIRADFNLSAVEAIRGGSASTFASNSPGGVINLISKTGDVEGGAVQVSTGLDYGEHRLDFDYGAKLSDTVRFHFGGFYRVGEGPRATGFDAYRGGQIKFNVTKQFANGFIRVYGKYLDDRSPQYMPVPVKITGTNDKPVFSSFPNFDIGKDSTLSRYNPGLTTLDGANQPYHDPISSGLHAMVKSVGLEAQFEVAGWSISNRARYSDISGSTLRDQPFSIDTASAMATAIGGAGATLSYASGPNAGQRITNPATLNGNGLVGNMLMPEVKVHSLNNFTNDLRANRSWKVGRGNLTVTGGVYKALQTINTDWLYTNVLQSFSGDGNSTLIDVTNAAGTPVTQDGFVAYDLNVTPGTYRRKFDVDYDITAPYGSVNYHIGKIAIGASVRYDMGKVRGQVFGSELGGGRIGLTSYDFNNDGKISIAEGKTAILPLTRPAPVHYDYNYLSYSTGINFRIAEPLAVWARYSRGARASADKILFTSAVSPADGSMPVSSDGYDTVKQTEIGVKFRKSGVNLNVTGFLADTTDHNVQGGTGLQVLRDYRAYGVELEGSFRRGPFRLTAGTTYTHAELVKDYLVSAVNGNTPRHQPKFIFQATPEFETRHFTVGFNVVGNTSSYAQDTNLLKMPGYTVVNTFLQIRPVERVQLMVNVNNLFDQVGFFEVTQASVPASGIGWGRSVNGRTISSALRFSF
ncbi:TonB-dependent receptor domain-containing protein [Sphingomonas hengshuiensis]|uniref:TonB-dependent receptor n=1 Tax=Sphingomonas hengshuiensis TaxID=1609977 RepID=A0A7U5BF59_9SPHN|nr:TonB-dependent receptor [Sphingomonas hengshuiensis]AJP74142.1 TonB-dependent receptor [Sphingomonas hengshuiensis]